LPFETPKNIKLSRPPEYAANAKHAWHQLWVGDYLRARLIGPLRTGLAHHLKTLALLDSVSPGHLSVTWNVSPSRLGGEERTKNNQPTTEMYHSDSHCQLLFDRLQKYNKNKFKCVVFTQL
jgi:hypothetical protein